jgi:hypothetical protein
LNNKDFKGHMPSELFRNVDNIVAVYLCLIIIGMFLWFISILIEIDITNYYRSRNRHFPFLSFFCSLFIPVFLIFWSVLPFVYRG